MARAHQAEQTAAACAKAIPVADMAVAELSISGKQNERQQKRLKNMQGPNPGKPFFPEKEVGVYSVHL